MSTSADASFERRAVASGLITAEAFASARARWAAAPPPIWPASDAELAALLVESGLLNRWQADQLLAGRLRFTLGPYRIIDSIGQGGMGQIFKAQHQVLGRIVAIKVLPASRSTPETIAAFNAEIRALARLNHPKLVRALDAGQDGNAYYLVTEYVPGLDLRKLVRRDGPLRMAMAARVIAQVAECLDYAHREGVIHRDVKPGNIVVTEDYEAKLLDLGLAGSLDESDLDDPRRGRIVGTADYVAPDHIQSPNDPTPAWDIYSLGCTLYFAVTSKVPFPGGTTQDKVRAHCTLRPLDPRRLNRRLAAEFVEVLAGMMARDPRERFASGAEVAARLVPFFDMPDLSPGTMDRGKRGSWLSKIQSSSSKVQDWCRRMAELRPWKR